MMDTAIGGYFGLELPFLKEYYENQIRLNSGRNALEYILIANEYEKIYIPFFTCDVLLEPLKKVKIKFQFYNIDENFEPIINFNLIENNAVFLYTNYFGLKDDFIEMLTKKCANLIIDNAQSFFSEPLQGVDTFYSPRKFFGLPDGAYLFSNKVLKDKFKKDNSINRFSHLLKRIDNSAEDGYSDFAKNDLSLVNQPILEMSNLTKRLLQSIDYEYISNKRISNFNYLHENLKHLNKLNLNKNKNQVPLVYPLWTENEKLIIILNQNKIYTATYWPNVLHCTNEEMLEHKLTKQLIHLPVDQRYSKVELDFIIDLIKTN